MTNLQIENLAYDLICFLKKWGLWERMTVYCNAKAYFDYASDFEQTACERGFRDLVDVQVSAVSAERWPEISEELKCCGIPALMLLCDGNQLYELLHEKRPAIRLSQLSDECKQYVIETEDLLWDVKADFAEKPILDDAEFDSHGEYLELEQELEDRLVEEKREEMDKWDRYKCGRETGSKILCELEILLEQHNVWWAPDAGIWSRHMVCFPK